MPQHMASGGASSGSVAGSDLNRFNPASSDPVGSNPINLPAPTGQGDYPFGPEWNLYTMIAGMLPQQQALPSDAKGSARGGRIRRFATGGTTADTSLLGTALDSMTAPSPSSGTRTLVPFPGDYNAYGFGPEWNFFADAPGTVAPTTPGSGVPPAATGAAPPPTGQSPNLFGVGNASPSNPNGGFGNKGPLGEGAGQAAADAAARNTAANPSFRNSLSMGAAMLGPLGALSLAGKAALSQFGIGANPFNPAGPTLSPEQQQSIVNSVNSLPQNAPLVTVANTIDNAIAAARSAPGQRGNFGGGFLGAGDPQGMADRAAAAAMGRGSSVGGGGSDSGDRSAGTQGGPGGSPGGGLGGGYRLARGGKAQARGLGFLSNGGRLHLAGGGVAASSSNPVLTSLVPIAAGLIGNIVSGPIGGAIASGAATAMTGGSLLDALANVGPQGGINSLFKYFPGLVGQGGTSSDTADQNNSLYAVDPTWAKASEMLAKLTSRVPSSDTGTASDGTPASSGMGALPYTKPKMAGGGPAGPPGAEAPQEPFEWNMLNGWPAGPGPGFTNPGANQPGPPGGYSDGGELDARGGTHVQGEGDGQSDDIPAKLSDGEFVFDSATTSALGNGSNKEGAARLEQLRKMIRARAGYKKTNTIPPKQKSVSALLGAVTRGKAA